MATALRTKAVAGIVLLAAVVAGYWYGSAYLAVTQMRSAAQEHDADAFNKRVDYPKLGENLKSQLAALMADAIARGGGSGSGVEAFGTVMGRAFASQMVDAMVRPEALMKVMSEGRVSPLSGANHGNASGTPEQRPDWTYEREGFDKLIAYLPDASTPHPGNDERPGFVFERTGFADWKLVAMRLPLRITSNQSATR